MQFYELMAWYNYMHITSIAYKFCFGCLLTTMLLISLFNNNIIKFSIINYGALIIFQPDSTFFNFLALIIVFPLNVGNWDMFQFSSFTRNDSTINDYTLIKIWHWDLLLSRWCFKKNNRKSLFLMPTSEISSGILGN